LKRDRGEALTLLAASAWWLLAAVFVIVAAVVLTAARLPATADALPHPTEPSNLKT
jgi:hypothetical protein